MGATKSTPLALEEECDDLVSATDGAQGLKRDEGFIVLAS